jgi:predicted DNA-binding protein (MmcQ/YjbR family)
MIAANLREQHECVKPGYHLNKKHWNTVTADGSLSMDELQAMIDHSYDLVLRGMTKAAREAILMRIGG